MSAKMPPSFRRKVPAWHAALTDSLLFEVARGLQQESGMSSRAEREKGTTFNRREMANLVEKLLDLQGWFYFKRVRDTIPIMQENARQLYSLYKGMKTHDTTKRLKDACAERGVFGFICTLRKDHGGPHAAFGNEQVYEVWRLTPDEVEDVRIKLRRNGEHV